MRRINYLAVVLAAVAAFVASAIYYTVLGSTWLELRGIDPKSVNITPQAWEMAGQFVRNIVVAFVFAYLIVRLGIDDLKESLRLGLWVWVGFQAMQIAGAVLHEGYPLALYAIHVGDALMTTFIMTAIIGLWPARNERDKAEGAMK